MQREILHVIEEFDPEKDYGVLIYPQYAKLLSSLKKGQKFSPGEFVESNLNEFTKNPRSYDTNKKIAYMGFSLGKKLGILESLDFYPISFYSFTKLDTVYYYKEQLRSTRFKNVKSALTKMNLSSTQKNYLYMLWNFNNWLVGKEFEFKLTIQTGLDTFKQERQKVILEGVEHLLSLYRQSNNSESDFIKIIKKYLLDPIHSRKKAVTIKQMRFAISGYFERNECPIQFKFDATAKYDSGSESDTKTMTLEDLLHLLTVGNPSIMEKAAFLSKFHRGLDTATFVDRFNFQAWKQLVEWFGTEQYEKWDLNQCPVPVKLVRMKTDYFHTGFLERDAIIALQKYLKYRYEKTGKVMDEKEPLFLNAKNEAIRDQTLRHIFAKLARRAGIQKKIPSSTCVRYEKDSHELRDLLKSTLLSCGVRYDVADHVIGHKPKDSYEKQAILYPENLRAEFMKASKKINIFSNVSHYMRGDEENSRLHKQIQTLQQELEKTKYEKELELEAIRTNQDKIFAKLKRLEAIRHRE